MIRANNSDSDINIVYSQGLRLASTVNQARDRCAEGAEVGILDIGTKPLGRGAILEIRISERGSHRNHVDAQQWTLLDAGGLCWSLFNTSNYQLLFQNLSAHVGPSSWLPRDHGAEGAEDGSLDRSSGERIGSGVPRRGGRWV